MRMKSFPLPLIFMKGIFIFLSQSSAVRG